MRTGSIWIKKDLAESALFLALNETGVVNAVIKKDHPHLNIMVTILYSYDDPHLKMVIAKELDRKIRNLTAP